MSRPIINADEHLPALSKRSQACVAAAVQCIKVARIPKVRKVHLHSQDFERITEELSGSGFDLGRGFKICGVRIEGVDNRQE